MSHFCHFHGDGPGGREKEKTSRGGYGYLPGLRCVRIQITPVNSTHRFVLQAIEKGTLQNLVFDNQAFANHRAMAAVFGVILNLPPLKQALASKQFKSVYLDKLLSSAVNKSRNKK